MSRIANKVQSLGYDESHAKQVEQHFLELDNLRIRGLDKLKRKLLDVNDLDSFRDYWFEGMYAGIFAESGLDVTIEPRGSEGPDMHTDINGHDIYVEVKHLRLVYDHSRSEARVVAGTIRDKFSLLRNGKRW